MKIFTRTGEVVFDMDKIAAAIEKACQAELAAEREAEAEQYRKYIAVMRKLGWPAFLDADTDFHQKIVESFEGGKFEEIKYLIYEHYSHLYLVGLEERISESCVIKKDRLPSLSEALLLYQLRYYHGAVAIITPQLIGIVSDLERYMEEHSMSYNPDNIFEIERGCGLESNSEKGRVLKAVLEGRDLNDEQGEYDCLTNYLRFKVFENRMSDENTEHHVNRHLFSHGIQVNYGTKDHALRVIMCMDALVWITQVISDEYDT